MRFIVVLTILAVLSSEAFASQIYVFPKQGQTMEQQSIDAGACRPWAMRESGVDPAYVQGQLAMLQSQQGSGPRQIPVARSMLRGVTTGAMMGHIKEENDDYSERGLKMGAAYGLKRGIGQRIDMQRQQQAEQAQAQQRPPATRKTTSSPLDSPFRKTTLVMYRFSKLSSLCHPAWFIDA